MRIAIVNDDLISTRILEHIVTLEDKHKVIWTAIDGLEAVHKCKDDTPDIILMDLIMPVMNGVEATREIMENSPCPILIVTVSKEDNYAMVFDAMGAGAMDVINTPTLNEKDKIEAINALHHKIDIIGRLSADKKPTHHKKTEAVPKFGNHKHVPLIAIGSSTGGPAALAQILSELPADINAAIVIIQHVDKAFSTGMAKWLNEQTSLNVRIAKNGDQPEPGSVLIAGTADHLILNKSGTLLYTEDPVDYAYRPSADVFFKTAAEYWPTTIIGILLTGMGRDGAEGLLSIKTKGMHTIAQNEETCAVYGMPKAAVEENAASEILPLDEISGKLLELLRIPAVRLRKKQGKA